MVRRGADAKVAPAPVSIYRDLAPGAFGPRVGDRERYVPTPAKQIRASLVELLEEGHGEIALAGLVVNASDEIGRRLAQMVRSVPGAQNLSIARAEWRPNGSPSPAVVDLLRSVKQLEIEFQSTDKTIRRRYRERIPLASYRDGLRQLESFGLRPTLTVYVGIPGESRRSIFETLRAAYSLEPYQVAVRRLQIQPGAFFDRNRRRYRVVSDDEPPYYVSSHLSANPFQLRWLEELAHRSARSYSFWVKRRDELVAKP